MNQESLYSSAVCKLQEVDSEDRKLMDEDKKYFDAADVNGDGVLNRDEFDAFHAPEHYPHMHKTVVAVSFFPFISFGVTFNFLYRLLLGNCLFVFP